MLPNITAYLKQRLAAHYDGGELDGVVRALCEDMLGLSRVQALMTPADMLGDEARRRLDIAVHRLADGEPVQYVTGTAVFMGIRLAVTPDTLIPRPETSGLVDLVGRWAGDGPRTVIDLCTGSGCVAIALALAHRDWDITAMDVSAGAVAVARANAEACQVAVRCEVADLMSAEYPEDGFDIVTCNPPYVLQSERAAMDDRVLLYEPPGALFVTDEDPLVFYRTAAAKARRWLKRGGMICFEINRAFACEVSQLLKSSGYGNVVAEKDYVGNYRFVKGEA